MPAPDFTVETAYALEALKAFGPVLSLKRYRLTLEPAPALPTLPCLDHEAMLHESIPPHLAAYIQDATSGDLHELVLIPARRRIDIDTVSTWGEHSDESLARLKAHVAQRFPQHTVRVTGPSWWRGESRVAAACRAQVSLREVLLAADIPRVRGSVERLQIVGSLMEKESRVASWGVRTVTGPLLAAAGVLMYSLFGGLTSRLGEGGVTALRYAFVTVLGACFLYYGLKAVQLTGMSNRVWKRSAEYSLILSERQKLAQKG